MRVIFKDLSAGFLVTPPAAIVSPHLMSPLASRDIFTGFSPNSGNDLAVTLLPLYLSLVKQEAAQTRLSWGQKCEASHVQFWGVVIFMKRFLIQQAFSKLDPAIYQFLDCTTR